jgi:hypothetical protein
MLAPLTRRTLRSASPDSWPRSTVPQFPLGPENISQLNKKTKGLSRLLDNFQPYQENRKVKSLIGPFMPQRGVGSNPLKGKN